MAEDLERELDDYDEDVLRGFYQRMRTIRVFEETVKDLIDRGEIPGETHLCAGQEAVAVGACTPLADGDLLAGTHRSHGHALALGVDPGELMAELGGKVTGTNSGRAGEKFLSAPDVGLLETNGLVGAGTPHVTGAMLAARLDGADNVGVAVFGDGGANQGVVHETMNLAGAWDLPVLFLCENNQYAVTLSADEATAGPGVAERAAAYGMAGQRVDGQDVLDVFEAVSAALDEIRETNCPQVIECDTYRFTGHFSTEDALLSGDRRYRSSEEIERARRSKDPLSLYAARLSRAGILPDDERDRIDEEVDDVIEDAIEHTHGADLPRPDRAFEHAYADQSYQKFPLGRYR